MPLNPRDQRYLYELEAESIEIIREVAASYERPAILYSVGKDSSVLLRLAQKAFAPGRLPFPLIHIDTGYKFREMYSFRDQVARDIGAELIVYRNEDAIAKGTNPYSIGTKACCGLLKTEALLQVLRKYEVDAAIGGARRDEERSRAKERIFSFRDKHGQWDPKNQRPELWQLYNSRVHPAENMRVFPLSNWTEFDVCIAFQQAQAVPARDQRQLMPLQDPTEHGGLPRKLVAEFHAGKAGRSGLRETGFKSNVGTEARQVVIAPGQRIDA